jgi:hypothetical protein
VGCRQVRDEAGDYVVEHLHDDEAVLVVDETGDVKKGTDTVGVSGSTPAPRAGSRTPKPPSTWLRRHQTRSQTSHYRRQAALA